MMFGHYPSDILISLSVFAIALWILFIFRTNIIIMIFSLELLLLANILGFTISAVYLNDIVGEIFSIFILAVAAIETAIALSILLSYYKITNKNIDSAKQYSEELLSALIITIGNSEYTILSWHGFCIFITIIFGAYIWVWGPMTYVVPGIVRGLYMFKYYQEFVVQAYLWCPTPLFEWLIKPESPYLTYWYNYGKKRQEREEYFWGAVWSIITLEFLPRRSNKLSHYAWTAFTNPNWNYEGWKNFPGEVWPFSWYPRFVAPYTLIGQRFLELTELHEQIHGQIFKEHKKECAKYETEIERLQEIIKVKDAYLEMYQRDLGGRR